MTRRRLVFNQRPILHTVSYQLRMQKTKFLNRLIADKRYVAQSSYFNFLFFLATGKKFSPVTTLLPVLLSNSLRAFLATAPPFLPATAFCCRPLAFSVSAILPRT
jgi:hypothetical protein